jgi:hypothetical protein
VEAEKGLHQRKVALEQQFLFKHRQYIALPVEMEVIMIMTTAQHQLRTALEAALPAAEVMETTKAQQVAEAKLY